MFKTNIVKLFNLKRKKIAKSVKQDKSRDCIIKPMNAHRVAMVPTGRVISRDISLRHTNTRLN